MRLLPAAPWLWTASQPNLRKTTARTSMRRVLLSVVIVNWNSQSDLAACLASMREQAHEPLELIVIDNGSEDGSAEMVRRDFPEVKLLAETENLGFAEACNRGIAASQGPWVCMLNNDTIADPHWAAELVRAAEAADPKCGMLQSLMLFMNNPDTVNSTGIALAADGRGRDRGKGDKREQRGEADEIFCPTAGAAAYRRSMLDATRLATGYFDSRYFMYYEDLDLGWRARLNGWSARYVPSSVVLHRFHGSSDRHGKEWLRRKSRINRVRTLLKNASWPMLLRASPRIFSNSIGLLLGGGPAAIIELATAAQAALKTRQEVQRLHRVHSRELERQWTREKPATSSSK